MRFEITQYVQKKRIVHIYVLKSVIVLKWIRANLPPTLASAAASDGCLSGRGLRRCQCNDCHGMDRGENVDGEC